MIGSVSIRIAGIVFVWIALPFAAYCGDPVLPALAKKYSLQVISEPTFPVTTKHGEINGKPGHPTNLDTYAAILNTEWNLYPPALVAKTKLKRIILCEELSFAGQLRTAIPDFDRDDLYFDVGRGRQFESYTRKVIHHEFFHVIDWRDDGNLYRDERWAALNPKTFKYGTGGKDAQNDSTTSFASEENAGFLNRYSTTGVEEDKAELFAHMIVLSSLVRDRAKKDPVINAKVERMHELIRAFCPKVEKDFWKAVEKMERSTDGKPKE